MSPNWGMYSGYEHCENAPASETNEEYLHSEKYQLCRRDWERPDTIVDHLTALNNARAEHPALRELRTLRFHGSTADEHLVVYSKTAPDGTDPVLVVVNLDPYHAVEALLHLDLGLLGLPWSGPYEAFDELTGEAWVWHGSEPYGRLDPTDGRESHVFALRAL